MFGLSDYEHLNRTKLTQIDVQVEVLKNATDRRLQVRIYLLVLNTGDGHAANSWQVNLAITVDDNARVEIDLPPGSNQKFVAGSDNVIRRHRNAIDRSKCTGHVLKQIASING